MSVTRAVVSSAAPSIDAPGMLMIGAAGRRCGKTWLATELVSQTLAAGAPRVAAAKVTSVHQETTRARCPRGKDGCGVCESLDVPYRLTRETGDAPGKDTTRLHEAGADPVLWLCVRPTASEEGARELLDGIGAEVPSVCESNSLRPYLSPSLFVVARKAGSDRVKGTCERVRHLADVETVFDGQQIEPGPDRFSFVDGRWAFRREATAIVLAGGQSRRMGEDKALLPVDGKPMVERVVDSLRPHFSEILVSTNSPERYEFLGLDMVPDRVPDQGPMMAVASSLERASNDLCFVAACDVVRPPAALMIELLRQARGGAQVVVPVDAKDRYEPLFGVYRRSARGVMTEALNRGARQLFGVYDHLETVVLPLPDGERVENVNTRPEYEALGGTETP